ncbi:MAG: hypothetical protein NTX45_25335 [Proteobacteria bacterium]|nr:hypothetical protein [Pseudomonadota bacterium]
MRNISKAFILIVAMLVSVSVVAGEITVKLQYKDGSSCGKCKVTNNFNNKEAYTNSSGVAAVDVGSADRKVTIYVGGNGAACAKAGESVSIKVKSHLFGKVSAIDGKGC